LVFGGLFVALIPRYIVKNDTVIRVSFFLLYRAIKEDCVNGMIALSS
jgi:hypothetical protein